MLWRPNSCCGVCVKSPPPPAPLLSSLHPDSFPTLFWTRNNKALINKVYFPVNLGAPPPLLANLPIFVPVPASLFDKTNPEFTPPPFPASELGTKTCCGAHLKAAPQPLPLFLEEPPSPKRKKKKNLPPCLRATCERQKFFL